MALQNPQRTEGPTHCQLKKKPFMWKLRSIHEAFGKTVFLALMLLLGHQKWRMSISNHMSTNSTYIYISIHLSIYLSISMNQMQKIIEKTAFPMNKFLKVILHHKLTPFKVNNILCFCLCNINYILFCKFMSLQNCSKVALQF